jgi:hypothetical protein
VRVPAAEAWTRGTDVDYLWDLVEYWAHHYDWRASERRIRDLPWRVVAAVRRGQRVVFHESTPDSRRTCCCTGGPIPSCASNGRCLY